MPQETHALPPVFEATRFIGNQTETHAMNVCVLGLGMLLSTTALWAQPVRDPAGASAAPCTNDDWASIGYYREANAALAEVDPRRTVFIGDSITQAWSDQPFIKNNPAFVGRGISGQTAPQMLVRFQPDVIALKPAVVHIMVGTNDVARRIPARRISRSRAMDQHG